MQVPSLLFGLILMQAASAGWGSDGAAAERTVATMDPVDAVDRTYRGNLFRGACVPRGMMLLRINGGHRELRQPKVTTCGFNGASMPVGNEDIALVPWIGGVEQGWGADNWPVKEQRELAPGWADVTYPGRGGLRLEMTATTRSGLLRCTFPGSATGTILFQPMAKGATVELVGKDRITATIPYRDHHLHVDLRFARPWKAQGRLNPKTRAIARDQTALAEADDGIYLEFDTAASPQVLAKLAKSYVSAANATASLEAENPGWDLAAIRAAARKTWNDQLSLIRIEGTPEDRRLFYTWFHHVLIHPTTFSDRNGEYAAERIGPGSRTRTATAGGRIQYTSISGWDIYRSWVQLHALILPRETSDLMQSVVNWSKQRGGRLPIWWVENFESGIMGGQSGVAILASGHAFGAKDFDTTAAMAAIETSLSGKEWVQFQKQGWMTGVGSANIEASVMHFSASRLAAAIGQGERASWHLRAAQHWRNVFDPRSGFIQPRNAAGAFIDDPKQWGYSPFVEASPQVYALMQTHNVADLIRLFGGPDQLRQRLAAVPGVLGRPKDHPYTIDISNEPSFLIPWLHCWLGQPAKANEWGRKAIADELCRDMYGDDDLGSLSGWAMWVMMGMYPAIIGEGGLALHGPTVPRIEMTILGGKRLVITAPGVSSTRRFVQSLTLNGKPWTSTWLPLTAFDREANTLDYVMGDSASAWGTRPEDAPPSFAAEPLVDALRLGSAP